MRDEFHQGRKILEDSEVTCLIGGEDMSRLPFCHFQFPARFSYDPVY